MKIIIPIILSITAILGYGQQQGIYQRDSIYRVNKVKARLWYSGKDKQLNAATQYDTKGRIIKFYAEPFEGEARITTYYSYDPKGHLAGMIDTIRNNDHNTFEIAKYDLEFDSGFLVKLTRYNPDRSIDYVQKFSNKRAIENLFRYNSGTIVENSTTEYRSNYLEERYFGWRKDGSKKTTWNYLFKYEVKSGQVSSYVRYSGKRKKETVRFFYDEKGLLLRIQDSSPDYFQYLYY